MLLQITGSYFLKKVMSSEVRPSISELFVDLPEQQQENIAGGCLNHSSGFSLYNLFFQKTDIETFANSAINVSTSNNSVSSVQQTGYKFSQITFGFSLGVRGNERRSRRHSSLLDMLFNVLSFF